MPEKGQMIGQEEALGTYRIADDVISIIAGLAATEIEGVRMRGGIAGGIADALGRKDLSKGVRVETGEREVAVDLYVKVEFGRVIRDVAKQVQENVKDAIESMTGLEVKEVNVYVQNIYFPEEKPIEESRVR